MIFTDRIITVRKGESKINEPIIVYRGDYELEVRFTIMNSKFKFMSGTNLIESENAAYGQLAILTPYGGNIFSNVAKCNEGTVTFVLTKAMLDQIEEVGLYSFQIRLFDYNKESRVSIPPVEFGIEVREPITSEDHDNSVNNAIVGYSIAKIADALNEKVPDTFNSIGDYNKTIWETGDRITEGKLNKIEDAIDKINQNEISDKNALTKQVSSNFNVLESEIDIVNNRISTVVAHAGNGTKDSELVDARKGHTTLYDRLEQLEDGTLSLNSAVTHLWEIGSANVTNNTNDDADTTTIRFKESIRFNMPVHITCPAGYHFAVWFVHEVGLHMGFEPNFMTDFTVPAGMAFKVMFRKNPKVTITQDEIGVYANIIQLSVVPSALVEHVAGDGRIAVKTKKIRNLFDKTKVFHGEDGNGGFYNVAGGSWQPAKNYVSSPFIPVEPGKLYRDRALGEYIYIQVVFWDENFNVCDGYSNKREDGWIKVPYNKQIKYLTLPIQKASIDTKMIIEWDMSLEDFPTDYIPYADEPQIADEHLVDVNNRLDAIDAEINMVKSMSYVNNPESILATPEYREKFRQLKEDEYVVDENGIQIYNIWSEKTLEEAKASDEYWASFITTAYQGSIRLFNGCLVVGYSPNSNYVYAYNGQQQFHKLSSIGETINIMTTDVEGFNDVWRDLKDIHGTVNLSSTKLSFVNPGTNTSMTITRDDIRTWSGDSTAELCWGVTAYINVIETYPYGIHFATLNIGIDNLSAINQLKSEVDILDNRIDSLAISGGAGAQWNGKTWYAYGTSITSVAQGKYAQYLAHISGMTLVNKGIPGGGLTNLGGYAKGQVKNAIMNTTDGKLNADLITLETGPNEGNETPHGTIYDTGDDTYCGCLTQCLQYLQANTNAQIVVFATVATTTSPALSQVYYERLSLIEQVCKVNHVYFVPTYDGLGTSRLVANGKKYTVDNIHQSDLGGYNKAQAIWSILKDVPLFYSSTDDLPTL